MGEQRWVRDIAPADFATGVPVTVAPTVTLARDVDPASVTLSTVRLLNGRTGAAVLATPAVSGNRVTLTPAAALPDNTPYRIVVTGLRDRSGARQAEPFSTTFRTVDLAPPAVGSLKATGAYLSATLTWTLPAITDLDQVIVRRNAGTSAPDSATAGTAVYAGTGTSATANGLAAGTTYTFGVWARDRSGRYSPVATARLLGTTVTAASSATTVTYGKAVTVTGKLTRKDNGAALTGQAVELHGRNRGAAAFTLLGKATSSSTGALSFSHKPTRHYEYQWIHRGASTAYTGAASGVRTVSVTPTVTATLSKTSVKRGGSVTLSGTVSPSHAGRTVHLQRLVGGAWKNVTSKKLSSTSGYSFSIKPTAKGTYKYRVYQPADSDHTSAASPQRSLKVT